MLVNSSVVKGRCPICGAAGCGCGGPSSVVAVDERVTAAGGGRLMTFPLGRPGASIQLTEEAARARGLLPPKKQEPVSNKKRPASTAANKARR